jgi:hypothetical protein
LRQDSLSDALALLGTGAGPRLAAAIGGAALLIGAAVELVLRRPAAAARKAAGPGAGGPPGSESPVAPRAPLPPAPSVPLPAPPPAPFPDSHPAAPPAPQAAVRTGRIAAAAAGVALFAALVGPRLAAPGVALLAGGGEAVLLDRANPSWHADLGPQRLGGLALQTSLIHGTGLAAGTPVARVRLLGTGTAPVELRLRAGDDTGEWAARRADVAAASRLPAPHPWQTWVAGDFFGQRYRARLPLPRPGSFARLEIDLAPGLPPDAGLALYQVELEP